MMKFFLPLFSALLLASPGFRAVAEEIRTPGFQAVMEDGFLISWHDLRTGEKFEFGKPEISGGPADAPYRPGAWSVDWKKDVDASKVKVSTKFAPEGDDAATIQMSGENPGGEVHALQWGLLLHYDKMKAVNWPRGLAPARLSGNGYPESMIGNDYNFNRRLAMLGGSSHIRHQYYVVEGEKGGLLIYLENPDLLHHFALEFKVKRGDTLLISNRSIDPPPWKDRYTSGRWVVRQYQGGVQNAAAIYRNYIEKAYGLVPLEKRPTAWVRDIAFVQVNDFARGPLPAKGFRSPNQDYGGKNYEKSLEFHLKEMEELAKRIDPKKVMFYMTDWRMDGMDMMFPNYNVDPYFALFVGRAKKLGFKIMLHCHNHLVHGKTTFFRRYIEYPYLLKNKLTKEPHDRKRPIDGVGYCALRNELMISLDKLSGSTWDSRKGLDRVMDWYTMNPAHEGFRYLMVGNLLSAVRATGADAIHLDVPNIWVDLRSDLYGMNQMQGQREFYRLLRKTLDENGFEHVAIATELTPFEGFMKYVDFAQNSRDSSAKNRAAAWESGIDRSGEELLAVQNAAEWKRIMDQRKEEAAKLQAQKKKGPKAPPVPPERLRELIGKSGDLGRPSLDNMVVSPYLQSYPHLGAFPGSSPVAKRLAIWYSLTHDVMMHQGGKLNFGSLNEVDKGKLALIGFFDKESPRITDCSTWADDDIACYRLKNGRELRIFRSGPSCLTLAFKDGGVLAELDLVDGWKNDAELRKYDPEQKIE